MTKTKPPKHPQGATLHLGGDAWAHPDLQPTLTPIDTTIPYPGNPRRGDQDAITNSIRDLGLYAGCILQRSTGHILVGNHRRHGVAALGGTQIAATWVDVDDTTAAAIVARDNLTSDRGGYDTAEQVALLAALEADAALVLSGYTDEDLTGLRAVLRAEEHAARQGLTDPDDAPPLPTADPISQPGDVWRLGPHRLVCGDATEEGAYAALLSDGVPVCVWTDPPYGVSVIGKSRALPKGKRVSMGGKSIQNDSLSPAALRDLVDATLAHLNQRCEPGSPLYVAAPGGPLTLVFGNALHDLKMLRQTIVWAKDSMVLGRSDYHYRHEVIWFGYTQGGEGRRGRGGAKWYGPNNETTVHEIPRPKRSDEHPTMKPVELVARALRNSTQPGDLVLDPFAGSGTTLIACVQEDRVARLIELDPRYADVICRRFQEHTGTLPVRDGEQVDFTQGD